MDETQLDAKHILQVGVRPGLSTTNIKKELLLFDELVVPELFGRLGDIADSSTRADFEWLYDRGLVRSIPYESRRDQHPRTAESVLIRLSAALVVLSVWGTDTPVQSEQEREFDVGFHGFMLNTLRTLAADLESSGSVRAAPVLPLSAHLKGTQLLSSWREMFRYVAGRIERRDEIVATLVPEDRLIFDRAWSVFAQEAQEFSRMREEGIIAAPSEDGVLWITLESLPLPDDSVALPDLFDYLAAPEVATQRHRLRRWIRRVASGSQSPNELRDEIEDLVESYDGHMRLAGLRSQPSVIETAICVPAEVAEHLVKLKWGAAARSLFGLRRQRAELLDAELGAPGRELAFIVSARKQFG